MQFYQKNNTRKLLRFEITKNVDCSLKNKLIVSFIIQGGSKKLYIFQHTISLESKVAIFRYNNTELIYKEYLTAA